MSFDAKFRFGNLVLARSPVLPPPRARRLPLVFAIARLRDSSFSEGGDDVLRLLEELGESPPQRALNWEEWRELLRSALHCVERALEMGTLTAFELLPFSAGAAVALPTMPTSAPASDPPPGIREQPPAPEMSWIEICLVEADGRPVSGEPYRIELTDGRVLTGNTDSAGMIRVAELPPGECRVCFEQLDVSDWETRAT